MGDMMGMMTLVRVLPEEMFEKVVALVRERRKELPAPPAHRHGS